MNIASSTPRFSTLRTALLIIAADTYNELGMLPKNVDLQKFMYDPHPHKDLTVFYWIASSLLGLALLIIAARLIIISRNLKSSKEQIRKQYEEIRLTNESLEEQVAKRTKELRNVNDLFQLFIKHSPIYAFIHEVTPSESRVLLSSDNYLDMIGISGSEMADKTMTELFPAELAAKITSDNWDVIASGRISDYQESYNGRSYHSIKFPIIMEDKALLAGYTIDITDQKLAEEGLRSSEALYHSMVETSQDMIWQCDTEGKFTYLNLAWEQTTGYELQEMLGTEFSAFQTPSSAVNSRLEFARLMEGESIEHYEATHITKAGNEISLIFNAMCLFDEQSEITGVSGTAHDITYRKQAEKELRQAKAEAEAAQEQLSLSAKAGGVAFWEYDVINNKLHWDDQMYLLYGVLPDTFENVYQAWEAVLHPDDVVRVNEDVRKALSDEKEYELDFRVVWPDCSIHTISAAGKVQRDTAGQAVRMIGVNWDITRAKQAEEAIRLISRQVKEKNSELNAALIATEQANAAKSQFLSNMSHEIRTPLNAIIGFSALLLNISLPPRQNDYVGKIHSAGELLLNIINDILDFSKVDARQLKMEQIAFRPAIIIDNVISMVEQKAREKGLSLPVDTSTEIATYLIGDPHRLTQIMVNLLGNAIKFTDCGEVALTLELLKQDVGRQQIRFSIRDTGIGLSAEQIGKLFQPFTQADESTTRRFGGTGLGLSICKQLVELMDGEIWCESIPGQGSTFRFTAWFGVGQASEVEQFTYDGALSLREMSTTFDFSKFHILLVEDNEVNQQLAIELLRDTGIVVEVASNGSDAVALVTGGTSVFDLVLMDIQMPVMDGYEATRLIRADNRFATLPIIAMTAHALLTEQQKILQSGMDAHITKPIDARAMLRVIGSFLGMQESSISLPDKHEDDGTATEAIPAIAGLDVTGALSRLDGNLKIYDWLLRSFVEKKAGAVKIIEEALRSGDTELAERTAHTLKSSAGTIGAVELELLAQNLETAIAEGGAPERVNVTLEHFAVAMERVVDVLANSLPPAPRTPED